jgi:hypothetical protein
LLSFYPIQNYNTRKGADTDEVSDEAVKNIAADLIQCTPFSRFAILHRGIGGRCLDAKQ